MFVLVEMVDTVRIPPWNFHRQLNEAIAESSTRNCHQEQVWLWEYETDEGAHDLYMDQGEEIRFRVTDEVFVDTSPTGPATAATDTPLNRGSRRRHQQRTAGRRKRRRTL
ncbi:DNA-directed RNA polymerase III subunit RPC8 isoform X2 [Lates japonicus]|uniref:DNA-directed RNA polymerase III subunit RPC8 isoform X2 n=1 Tax=Lates japonicus TaxID=270547 RepID=A0AAD3MVX4_LATJO|nr:DNA-directed RNA polymerase III subunit RPC8 isoform X2 [Lates japonicus]